MQILKFNFRLYQYIVWEDVFLGLDYSFCYSSCTQTSAFYFAFVYTVMISKTHTQKRIGVLFGKTVCQIKVCVFNTLKGQIQHCAPVSISANLPISTLAQELYDTSPVLVPHQHPNTKAVWHTTCASSSSAPNTKAVWHTTCASSSSAP